MKQGSSTALLHVALADAPVAVSVVDALVAVVLLLLYPLQQRADVVGVVGYYVRRVDTLSYLCVFGTQRGEGGTAQ